MSTAAHISAAVTAAYVRDLARESHPARAATSRRGAARRGTTRRPPRTRVWTHEGRSRLPEASARQ
jgi:hypothetical protein